MIKEKIAKLIDLKSIVTLLMSVALVIGFFKGAIPVEQFIPLVTMVYMFYFQKDKNNTNGVG